MKAISVIRGAIFLRLKSVISLRSVATISALFSAPFAARFTTLVAILLSACGQPHSRTSAADREKLYQKLYSPTAKNTASWAHLWDGHSWIGALKDSELTQAAKDKIRTQGLNRFDQIFELNTLTTSLLRSRILDSFTTQAAALSPFLVDQELLNLRDILFKKTRFEFTFLPADKIKAHHLVTGDEATEWFVRIELPKENLAWDKLFGISVPRNGHTPLSLSKLAILQFDALSAIDDFAWVEPNLANEMQQAQDPESEKKENRPEEWYNDETGQAIDPKNNRIRQVLTRINWHLAQDLITSFGLQKSSIPVAIFDSGVDYQHSELKDRMFKNPAENLNGTDDDGNGIIDDVYGFDATFGPGEVDTSFTPPGSADVGGPGAKCDANIGPDNTGTCGHGTHVAGIVAARAGGKTSFGICDACSIFSVRTSKACLYPDSKHKKKCIQPKSTALENGQWIGNGKLEDWAIVRGLSYLLNFKDPQTGNLYIFIANFSFGKYFFNRAMASALTKLEANGVLTIAAAGNDATDTPMFPAGYRSTLAVCATSEDSANGTYGSRGNYAKADFSNFGDWVDVCAPGVSILSTLPGEATVEQRGTSMAAPVVAAAAGFIWSVVNRQAESNESIRKRIERYSNPTILYDVNSNPLNRHFGDEIGGVTSYLLGWGFLDIHAALKAEQGSAPKSFVKSDAKDGFTSQVNGGCIVSSIGQERIYFTRLFTSVPFLLFLFLGFLRSLRSLNLLTNGRPGSK